MPSVGIAQSAARRREPTLSGWIALFAALLHLGAICLLLAAMPSQPAHFDIAGGNAGENGGGGMGFHYNGDGLGQAEPLPPLPQIHPSAPAKPAHQAAMAQDATSLQQLEAMAASPPVPPPVDPRQMLSPSDAHALIGLAAALPGQAFQPHHGQPTFPGMAIGDGHAGPNTASASAPAGTGTNVAPGSQLASVAGPHGIGGDGGGPVGDPGARGNPGLGNGPATGMKLKYPEESRRCGEEGTVILAIEIMPDGQHGEIEVVQSSGFWRLDEAALDAARRANYAAVLVDGRPLANKKRLIQPFVFQLKDADGT